MITTKTMFMHKVRYIWNSFCLTIARSSNLGSLSRVEKRSVFLERVAARLRLRGPHFTDADLGAAIQAALMGLIQSAT
jgi:hypothetical protein